MKSWIVHYKNKYPGCKVHATETSLDVYRDEDHIVSLVKNGAGQWVDQSESLGCEAKHCLSAIPRDARVHKLCKETGNIILDDQAVKRATSRRNVMNSEGIVESIAELEAKGYKFSDKGDLVSAPQKAAAPQVVSPQQSE